MKIRKVRINDGYVDRAAQAEAIHRLILGRAVQPGTVNDDVVGGPTALNRNERPDEPGARYQGFQVEFHRHSATARTERPDDRDADAAAVVVHDN